MADQEYHDSILSTSFCHQSQVWKIDYVLDCFFFFSKIEFIKTSADYKKIRLIFRRNLVLTRVDQVLLYHCKKIDKRADISSIWVIQSYSQFELMSVLFSLEISTNYAVTLILRYYIYIYLLLTQNKLLFVDLRTYDLQYRREIIALYNKQSFFGNISRQLLIPPVTVVKLPKRTPNGFISGCEERLPPRLSLRPLASYTFLISISCGIFIAWFTTYVVL